MQNLHAKDIAEFLQSQSKKETLRFITCGSVDDGKSTLIGRLLFESKNIFDDQLEALKSDLHQYGTQGGKMDLTLLADGLQAEREQGITIDVAYRFFATDRRRYIVADTPGHEQYTRNMATGASTADLAVILIDARKGVLTQTRRHSRIVAMMGIRHVVLAVNKMDLLGFDETVFQGIVADYRAFAADLEFSWIEAIPVSGLEGDNVLEPSERMPWYGGPSLMAYLDMVDVTEARQRGAGRLALVNPPEVADQFEAKLLWMSEHAMTPGRQFLMRLACQEVTATVTRIKYREDVNTGAHLAASNLSLNEIASVNLSTSAPLVFEPYGVNRVLGGFILIDKLTFDTVGAGMIDFALRRASNIHWQALELNKAARAAQKDQTPRCVWFTGLSGSGKSTIANLLDKRLHADGRHTYVLDGDNVRHGLNRDLGFTDADRVENIRRVAEVAKLMADAGLIVLVSFISPFRAERRMARDLFAPGEFVEVFVDASLQECERRDAKGLYAKARRGELRNFTGIDSPYEAPEAPELHLHADKDAPEVCVAQLLADLTL